MSDNYIYPIKPLPGLLSTGGNSYSNDNSTPSVEPVYPVSSAINTPSPFSNPDFGNGGGGGSPSLTCDSNESIGIINTTTINLPCSSSVSSITQGQISLLDSGGNTASLSAVNGWVQLSSDAGQLNIQLSDINSDSGVIRLIALDVCHMGFPGLRQFVCGDAYASE